MVADKPAVLAFTLTARAVEARITCQETGRYLGTAYGTTCGDAETRARGIAASLRYCINY